MKPLPILEPRERVEVRVVDQEQYEEGPFDFGNSAKEGSLDAVIRSLIAIRNTIPEKYRNIARCEISSAVGMGVEHQAFINVDYARPAKWYERLRFGDVISAKCDVAAKAASVNDWNIRKGQPVNFISVERRLHGGDFLRVSQGFGDFKAPAGCFEPRA